MPSEPHAHKPDPDEPWRYACPDCGSVNVQHQHTVTCDERRFQCQECNWYGVEPQLVDKQTERGPPSWQDQ